MAGNNVLVLLALGLEDMIVTEVLSVRHVMEQGKRRINQRTVTTMAKYRKIMTDKNSLRPYAIMANELFPQEWKYQGNGVYCNGLMVAETFGPYETSEIDSDKIARYIAWTEPKTIIEMLDYISELQTENTKLKAALEYAKDGDNMAKTITIKSCSECPYTNKHEDFCTEACEPIGNLYSIPNWCPLPDDKLNQQVQWIHVSQKLPDEFQQVLVYSGMTMFVCTFSEGEFCRNDIPYYVDYWMPLPFSPKCVNCITEEMKKFTVDSRVDRYMDCGNECPKCGLIIWTWKVEDMSGVDKTREEMIKSRSYLLELEKENTEMKFILEGLCTHLKFDTSYSGIGWYKRIKKVLGGR